jgi:hypothetical protein
LVEYTTSRQGAVDAFPASAGANDKAVDITIRCIAGGIDGAITAEPEVKSNTYVAA